MKKLFLIGVVMFVFGIVITKAQTSDVKTYQEATQVQADQPKDASAATSTDEKKACAMACCAGKKGSSAKCSAKDKAKCDKAKAKGCCAAKKEASPAKEEEKSK